MLSSLTADTNVVVNYFRTDTNPSSVRKTQLDGSLELDLTTDKRRVKATLFYQ